MTAPRWQVGRRRCYSSIVGFATPGKIAKDVAQPKRWFRLSGAAIDLVRVDHGQSRGDLLDDHPDAESDVLD
jgi:hypothetical protein